MTETYSTIGENNISPLQTLDASLRGYVMRQKAPSQVFPSLGFGAELGFHFRPGHMKAYNPTAYLYTYGYLPGFTPVKDSGSPRRWRCGTGHTKRAESWKEH